MSKFERNLPTDQRKGAPVSYTDIAEMHFKANPNTWLYWSEFAQRCGRLAWRTRIAECRKRGLDIVNRLEKDSAGVVHSYYMYRAGV